MLTVKFIEECRDEVIHRLAVKGFQAGEIVGRLLDVDTQRKRLQTQADSLQAELNTKSKEIGILMKSGQKDHA